MPPLDFPNSPTGGQTYTGPGGIVWAWDGAKWGNGVSAASAATPSDASPAMDGTAAAGASALYSRGDHVHPSDTSRYAASNPSGYQTAAQVTTALAPYATLAAPVFTGDARAVTPAAGDADTSIATTQFVSDAVATSLHDVGRNYLHNSMFRIQQRGTGAFTNNMVYTADRWQMQVNAGTLSVAMFAFSDANRAQIGDEAAYSGLSAQFTGTAGAFDELYIAQKIEDVRRIAGKTVTLSFWAACNSGALKLGATFFQLFGTGGSPSGAASPGGQSVTLSTTYTRYTLTFTMPSAAAKTFGTNPGTDYTELRLAVSAGATAGGNYGSPGVQSGAISFWGVQLELGPTATPLEKLDPQQDLARCQRFYQTGYIVLMTYNTAGGVFATSGTFAVQMRGTATMAVVGSPSLNNATAAALTFNDGKNFSAQATTTALGHCEFTIVWSATADL